MNIKITDMTNNVMDFVIQRIILQLVTIHVYFVYYRSKNNIVIICQYLPMPMNFLFNSITVSNLKKLCKIG